MDESQTLQQKSLEKWLASWPALSHGPLDSIAPLGSCSIIHGHFLQFSLE